MICTGSSDTPLPKFLPIQGGVREHAILEGCVAAVVGACERELVAAHLDRVTRRMAALLSDEDIDLTRMRRERHARLQVEMERADVDVVLAIGLANVHYLTGATVRTADSARCHYERTIAIAFRGKPFTHVFGPYPEGFPAELPPVYAHPPIYVEFSEGVESLAAFLKRELAGIGARIGVDEYTAAMFGGLSDQLAGHQLVDGGALLGAARLCKTGDELKCIRHAQRINESAIGDVLPLLRPGIRQCELSARFLRRIQELGASANEIDPIWQPIAPHLSANPFATSGDVPFPRSTTDRFLSEGDQLWVDTGISFHGYTSDFGRTWLVGRRARPTARQQDQFKQWCDVVDRVCEATRPGATGGDLARAACAGRSEKPWMKHFYLIHGLGLNSAEMPLIGTDLGTDFDERIVLAPGMVLVLEPTIWEDGQGGYRSEEIIAVTEEGYLGLSEFPYTPYGEAQR